MILSSRPTDRRQLIEEAAGVTKYKARRRSAELKLDAARQNLLRVDDIVFEVEKQRGTLKRQAAKARRYRKLRDELRRWEKVLFARKYRQLAETIESARGRLADARERESVASARVAQVESELGRLRIEMAEAEARATQRPRSGACPRARDQPAAAADRLRSRTGRFARRTRRRDRLRGRDDRGPARAGARCRWPAAARRRSTPRPSGSAPRPGSPRNRRPTRRGIARSRGSSPTSRPRGARCSRRSTRRRRCAMRWRHAAAARDRVAETLQQAGRRGRRRRIQSARAEAERTAASDGLRRAHDAIEATRIARLARESELASARIEHEWRARSVRAAEQTLAGLEARLTSLAELEAGARGVRRRAARRSGAGQRQGQPAGRDRRLSRGRGRLRTRGRSVPRRSAPARRRRKAGARRGRLRGGARSGRGTVRIPDHGIRLKPDPRRHGAQQAHADRRGTGCSRTVQPRPLPKASSRCRRWFT